MPILASGTVRPRRKTIPSLHDTISRLSQRKRAFAASAATAPVESRLEPLGSFGSNPGALKAWVHVPESFRRGAPLVVVLHGCTQDAAGYDHGAGWSRLADEQGFALLFPEQTRSNNPNLCFNWFSPGDSARGGGEALSIRQMIAAMEMKFGTDPARVFVTGLSAGGAMTAVMLATYPELFAGGAVIAGLPYGAAQSVPEAFDRMRGHAIPEAPELTRLVRSASRHKGNWPTLSIWHGSADATVDPVNATALVDQWRQIHGVTEAPTRSDQVDGYPHHSWADASGRTVIEEYQITGMGHGTPLDTSGEEVAGPFMLDVGISSTRRIAAFWGISKAAAARASAAQPAATRPTATPKPAPARKAPASAPSGIARTIEDALRSTGLMR